jgi:hypothetical protein
MTQVSAENYSSTLFDGKFTSENGCLCRRFWRHFSLDAKIIPKGLRRFSNPPDMGTSFLGGWRELLGLAPTFDH